MKQILMIVAIMLLFTLSTQANDKLNTTAIQVKQIPIQKKTIKAAPVKKDVIFTKVRTDYAHKRYIVTLRNTTNQKIWHFRVIGIGDTDRIPGQGEIIKSMFIEIQPFSNIDVLLPMHASLPFYHINLVKKGSIALYNSYSFKVVRMNQIDIPKNQMQ